MRYNRLDLNLLIALKALLTEQNVTRAGETIFVTQSAMSGILARLRDYFDDPLIVQVGRKAKLTPLAESLLEPVTDVLVRIDAAISTRLVFDPAVTRRHFSIVTSDYVQSVFLIDFLRTMHREAPNVTLELRQPSENASADLEAGEVDFIISPDRFISQSQSGEALFEDDYVVAVSADNPHVGDTIDLESYVSMGHVTFQNGTRGRPMFESWFAKQHGEMRRVEVTAHTFNLLPQLIIGTRRVATLHQRLARRYAAALPIRLVRPLFQIPTLVEVLQWHKYRDLDPGSAWLRDRIIAMARELPPLPDNLLSTTARRA